MKSKTFAIIGFVMLAIAVIFFLFAINHPELGFPWPLKVTHTIYTVYLTIMGVSFLMAIVLRIIEMIKNRFSI